LAIVDELEDERTDTLKGNCYTAGFEGMGDLVHRTARNLSKRPVKFPGLCLKFV
jgi:hypothetical protein